MWKAVTLVVTASLAAGASDAGTLIYPHAHFLHEGARSSVFYVHNTGDEPAEVEVALAFGYPASNAEGGIHVELIDDPDPGFPSAAAWVRALPQRVILQPNARQAVRLLATPPPNLPAGEYWARILVTSRTAEPPQPVGAASAIRVGLTLQTRTITSLVYRKGQVSTGVQLNSFRAAINGNDLVADLELERNGNAAYLGQLELTLQNLRGGAVARWTQAIAVYYELYRRLEFPVGDLPPGEYEVRVRLSTARDDLPSEHVLPAEIVEAGTGVEAH